MTLCRRQLSEEAVSSEGMTLARIVLVDTLRTHFRDEKGASGALDTWIGRSDILVELNNRIEGHRVIGVA